MSKTNIEAWQICLHSFCQGSKETAPFQESMFVSFLLGQLANVQGSHPGEKLKYILESLGGTGISIGQKIYQRRMIPDEYLEHLKNMTDHSPLPSRKAIYDRVKSSASSKSKRCYPGSRNTWRSVHSTCCESTFQ